MALPAARGAQTHSCSLPGAFGEPLGTAEKRPQCHAPADPPDEALKDVARLFCRSQGAWLGFPPQMVHFSCELALASPSTDPALPSQKPSHIPAPSTATSSAPAITPRLNAHGKAAARQEEQPLPRASSDFYCHFFSPTSSFFPPPCSLPTWKQHFHPIASEQFPAGRTPKWPHYFR